MAKTDVTPGTSVRIRALLNACGSDDSGDPTNPASVPASGGGRGQGLAPLAGCLRQNGVDLPESPTRAQLLEVFRNVDKAKREQIRQACGSLAPSFVEFRM